MMPINQLDIQGLLLDLDGVLYVGPQPIEGAIDAVASVRSSGMPCRFITNTSTLSLDSLARKINALGFTIPPEEIISAPQAAVRYLRETGSPACRLLLAEDVKKDFAEFRQSDTEAEVIVIGDIGNAWSYELLNEVFNCLMRGAKLIAIHKNRFWQTEHGLQMDIGGFVHGLEYASNTSPMIIGKPSEDFFRIALDDMGLKAPETAIIGDDIDSDVGGGQQVGLQGILVKTGKFRQAYLEASSIKPDLILDSVRDLPGALGL
jgi:HAD superfamily hydrolase (TIGR01458 family)